MIVALAALFALTGLAALCDASPRTRQWQGLPPRAPGRSRQLKVAGAVLLVTSAGLSVTAWGVQVGVVLAVLLPGVLGVVFVLVRNLLFQKQP